MKKILNLLSAAVLLGTTTACTDILDTAPYDQLSSNTMWTTESSVDQGVIGVYYSLQRPFHSNNDFVGVNAWIGYYAWDAMGMTGQGEYGMANMFTKSVNPSNRFFLDTWQNLYDGIHRANAAIAGIANSPIEDEEKKARLVAECKVLRAFFYQRLNLLFGNGGIGVPLYTEPVDPDQCNKVQSPEAEVWAQVIQDLTDAINEPALKDNDIQGEGRVSRGAAYALRGKTYLITGEYELASKDFEQVGKCGYQLFNGGYKELFKEANERCEEMILSVQYIEDPSGYGTSLQKYCAAWTQGSQDSRGCWTDLQVTPALVNLYEEVDPNDGTVKDFAWEDYLGDAWTYVTQREAAEGHTKYRKVFFLRDTLVNNATIDTKETMITCKGVVGAVKDILAEMPADIQAYYLPEGNEARLKTAYAHRDPRLAYNVVTPYANYLGVNSTSTEEGWYTYRYPVTGKNYFNMDGAEPNANPNLPADYYASGFCNAQNEFKYIHRKFVGEGLEYQRRDNNPVDEPIMRYADVLLMWAEAEVEQGNLDNAKALVKQVRDRAGIVTPDSKFTDKDTARNYVRDERRREFVNEGVNFFDEMRWRTLKETKFSQICSQHAWGGTESTGGTTYDWIGDQWYTWPVPKSEIELNPEMKMTPGWEY